MSNSVQRATTAVCTGAIKNLAFLEAVQKLVQGMDGRVRM